MPESAHTDDAATVRPGEELDAASVGRFLGVHDPRLGAPPDVLQFAGGASNLTYLLRYPARDLVLRRPPFGHRARSAHDVVREARVLEALGPVFPLVPRVVAVCTEPSVIGADFFVMERIPGIILRRDLPPEPAFTEDDARRLCENFVDTLVRLHAVDVEIPALKELGRGEGYVHRQFDGWTDRYRRARTEDVGDFADVISWLEERRPSVDAAACLIHNDFRFDNVVLDPDRPTEIVGVLDWEMATVGDPLMDLGNSLAYWIEAGDDPVFRRLRRQPTNAPGMMTRAELVQAYEARSGRTIRNLAFYEVFGLFRLAGIAQQIYRRYSEGNAANPAFAAFGDIVRVLEARCRSMIET